MWNINDVMKQRIEVVDVYLLLMTLEHLYEGEGG